MGYYQTATSLPAISLCWIGSRLVLGEQATDYRPDLSQTNFGMPSTHKEPDVCMVNICPGIFSIHSSATPLEQRQEARDDLEGLITNYTTFGFGVDVKAYFHH